MMIEIPKDGQPVETRYFSIQKSLLCELKRRYRLIRFQIYRYSAWTTNQSVEDGRPTWHRQPQRQKSDPKRKKQSFQYTVAKSQGSNRKSHLDRVNNHHPIMLAKLTSSCDKRKKT